MQNSKQYQPHRFPYLWRLADGYPAKGIEPHGCKVFGTFICGGGSSMGYKLAGYHHLGGVELDPSIAAIYKQNHHPEHLYIEDIRDFNKRTDLPAELYQLDILDGSPPCSTFSMAGKREKAWGKEKQFAEGQKMLADLPKNMIEYMFPGIGGKIQIEDAYRHIREITGIGDQSGFLYKHKRHIYFHPVPNTPAHSVEETITSFIGYLWRIQEQEFKDSEISYFGVPEIDYSRFIEPTRLPRGKKRSETCTRKPQWAALDEFERKFDITIQDLDIILGYRVKLSRMTISQQNVIRLIDWENSPVVKMDDVTKALYFFFLKHPEGAVLKDLDQFRREILDIYLGISGREDLQGINETIDRLIAPYSDGRNSSMSRIRKAFKDIVGDRAAKFYYIDGKAGGTYTIHLDRDLVLWEH